jgi:hypothetical protein
MRTWNMIVGLGCFAGMSLGLAACGGFSNLGDGAGGEAGEGGTAGASMRGGSGGKSMGSGGTMTPGSGGTMSPGAGGTMTPGSGGTMMPGSGGTMMPGSGGTMMPGSGGTTTPGSGGTMLPGSGGSTGTPWSCAGQPCGSMCLGSDDPMQPNGPGFSGMCDANGVCQREPTSCDPPQACMSREDCGGPLLPNCEMCANGESACPETDCVMGFCVTRPPECPSGRTQCQNVACGTPCDPCAEGEMCPEPGMGAAIYATCDAHGQCRAGEAECGAACMTSADCPQLPGCRMCEGASNCVLDVCVNGRCQLVCPVPMEEQCQVDMDCPPPPPICQMCPNGSCAVTTCIEGSCVFGCSGE